MQGPWTPSEDAKVKALVKDLGPKKWSIIASHLPGRIGKFTIFSGVLRFNAANVSPPKVVVVVAVVVVVVVVVVAVVVVVVVAVAVVMVVHDMYM